MPSGLEGANQFAMTLTQKEFSLNRAASIKQILISICLGLSSLSQAQVYQFTAPIDGFQSAGIFENGRSPSQFGAGGILTFGTLTETIFYDPVAHTMREVGSFTISPTSLYAGRSDDRVNTSGILIPAYMSVAYTFNGGNNTVSFDTGVKNLQDRGNGQFSSGGPLNWVIPYSAYWTLTTGSQDYYGWFSGSYHLEGLKDTKISQITPDSLVIQQGNNRHTDYDHPSQNYSITANGINYIISNEHFDNTTCQEYYVAPVTAFAVPEPGSLMLFTLGVFGFISWRKSALHKGASSWH